MKRLFLSLNSRIFRVKDVGGKDLGWFQAQLKPRLQQELTRISSHLDSVFVEAEVERRWKQLQGSMIASDTWKTEFPGKILVSQFCSKAKINRGYFFSAYLAASK